MRVGYVRVSSVDKNTARQLDGVEVERTFTDRASGKDTGRPKLEEMLAFVRDGDVVLVHSMDRLARNLEDLRRIVRTLTGKGVRVEFVKEQLTFSGEDSPMATLMLSVMGAFAEFERALILERQREGIAAAKARGVYTGRKPALTGQQADELRRRAADGEHKSALARDYRISRETVYAYLRPDATPSPADGAQDTPTCATAPAPALNAQTSSPPSAIAAPAVRPQDSGRTVDLSAELGTPAGTWQLLEAEPGSWHLRHAGTRVGVVRREATNRGRRGWLARLDSGVPLPARGDLAAAGSTLWRTRNLAAAAVARHAAPATRRRR